MVMNFLQLAAGMGQIIITGEHTIERIVRDFYGVEQDIEPIVKMIAAANPHLTSMHTLISGAPLNLPLVATPANDPPIPDQAGQDQADQAAEIAPIPDQAGQDQADQDQGRKKK